MHIEILVLVQRTLKNDLRSVQINAPMRYFDLFIKTIPCAPGLELGQCWKA